MSFVIKSPMVKRHDVLFLVFQHVSLNTALLCVKHISFLGGVTLMSLQVYFQFFLLVVSVRFQPEASGKK